jgi:hypothetical protein
MDLQEKLAEACKAQTRSAAYHAGVVKDLNERIAKQTTYCYGQRFTVKENQGESMLVLLAYATVSMICLESGNRALGYLDVGNSEKVTIAEMNKLCDFDNYTLITS